MSHNARRANRRGHAPGNFTMTTRVVDMSQLARGTVCLNGHRVSECPELLSCRLAEENDSCGECRGCTQGIDNGICNRLRNEAALEYIKGDREPLTGPRCYLCGCPSSGVHAGDGKLCRYCVESRGRAQTATSGERPTSRRCVHCRFAFHGTGSVCSDCTPL